MSGLWAVLPVKSFARAKSRLAPTLDLADRAELAQALFLHGMSALAACSAVAGVLVATDSEDVAKLAARAGAAILMDAGAAPLGRIVDAALADLAARGAGRALVVMSDLPHVEAADLTAVIDALEGVDLALAPDLQDEGTNALAVGSLRELDTCFGSSSFGTVGSFGLHQANALQRGLRAAVVRRAGLGFDVDSPADYARFLATKRTVGSRVSAA